MKASGENAKAKFKPVTVVSMCGSFPKSIAKKYPFSCSAGGRKDRLCFSGDLKSLYQRALFEKATKTAATEIKAPKSSVHYSYVYIYLMVKMRINFGSVGLLWFNLVWG